MPRVAASRPLPAMWHHCPGFLLADELDVLRPRFVLALGADARWALGKVDGYDAKQSCTAGVWRGVVRRDGWEAAVYSTYHPAARGGRAEAGERALIRSVARTRR